MKKIAEWLSRPFEQAVFQYRVMWHWQTTTEDDEAHLRSYVARAHPIWHARFRLAQWLPRAEAKCRNIVGPALAVLLLLGAGIYIAVEVVFNRIARTVRRSDG